MQEFRRFVRGPMGKVLLIAIIVPFVVSGFYGYFTATGSGDEVAEVEGNKISRTYVNSRVEQIRSMLRQQSPDLDPAMLDAFVRPEMVLEGIINEQLILAAASDASMAFSEQAVARQIYSSPQFMENGRFSELVFERETRRRGMTPQGYVRALHDDLVSRQYQEGFVLSDFALPVELAERRRLGEQRRDIRYVMLSPQQVRDAISVSDDEVAAFYDANSDSFMRPEQLKVAYLELRSTDYADQVTVSDEDVAQEYEARRAMAEQANAAAAAQRVAHILIEVGGDRDLKAAMARAEEARAAIAAGADFADIAGEYSDDLGSASNGGDLGVISKGALPSSLEQAIADLQPGELSAPVESDAGVHLLTVSTERKALEWPELAQMADDIRDDLMRAKAGARLFEDAALLEELVFEHNDLQGPAERVGASVQVSNWLSLDSAEGALGHPRVIEALSSADLREDGHNSDLIEIAGDHYIAVRIEDRMAAQPLSLEEVADGVRQQLIAEKAQQQVAELSAQAREQAQAGASLADIASLFGADIEQAEGLQRGSRQPSAELVENAFSLPRPLDGESAGLAFAQLSNGAQVAYQLTAVHDGEAAALSAEEQRQALAELADETGQRNFQQIVAYLRDSGSVKVNRARFSGADE